MNAVSQDRTPFLRFQNLSAFSGLWHGVFTRRGGVSPGPYRSLNVGRGVGDTDENVAANRKLIRGCLPSPDPRMVSAHQVHGSEIILIGADQDAAPSVVAPPRVGDALVTALPGTYLMIQVADCQAILLYDPVCRVVANIHAGWRGSLQNICGRTIEQMASTYGCRSQDLMAGISPSLGPCCAEFIHYKKEFPQRYWDYHVNACHFDFWSLTRDQLIAAGVSPARIEISGLCTRCRTDRFFSFRREGITGRFAALIGLRGV